MDPFRIFCQDNLNPKNRSCPIAVQEDKSFLQKVLFFIVKNVLLEKVGAQSGPGWGPVRVGALSGLGPCPGWGPVRVGALSGLGPIWAHMGPYGPIYGPIWAHVGPYGPIWVLLDRSWKKRQLSVNFP